MADNNNVKSKRERTLERLRAKSPDKRFEDDEEVFGQINDDYDDYDNQLNGYKDRESKLAGMFSSDPRSARFVSDWSKGEDPAVGLVRNYGFEIKDIIDDPDRQEEMAKANREYVERVAESKKLDEEYEKNLKASLEMLEKLQKDEGLTDEEIDGAMNLLMGVAKDAVLGKFQEESVRMAMKALNYERDMGIAGEEGEIRGRNRKVDEQLRHREKGDGTPQLNGRNGQANNPEKKKSTIFDLAREAM